MNAGIELRHLRYFLAVESELSFTRAAARLGLAQPNLSEQIRQLEVRVGTLLFQRTKRRVELTAAGRAFGAEALRTLAQADRAVEAARLAAAGRSGVVRVGFVESAGIRFLPPLLGTFAHTHPSVEVSLHQLSTAQQVAGLERRELDVGFMTQVLSTAFRSQPVARERINVVLPTGHELAERDVVPLRMLDGETLLFRTREVAPAAFDAVMSAFREAGVVPRLVLHPVGASMLQGLVAHGAGLTLASEAHSTRRDLAVVYRPLVEPELHSDLYAVWTGDEPEPATAEFLAAATAARADS
jgi:DNA-binding transcriptional LysR family regulator